MPALCVLLDLGLSQRVEIGDDLGPGSWAKDSEGELPVLTRPLGGGIAPCGRRPSMAALTRSGARPVWPQATRLSRPRSDPVTPLAALLEAVARSATAFDIPRFESWRPSQPVRSLRCDFRV